MPFSKLHHVSVPVGIVAALLVVVNVASMGGWASGRMQPEAPLRTAPADKAIVGRYIVVFRRDRVKSASEVRAKIAAARGAVGVGVRHVYESALFGYAAQLSDAALAQVRADPDVAYVEQDRIVRISGSGTQADPPWGLDRVDQRTLPLNQSYAYDQDGTYDAIEGKTVHAYVVDTGIRSTHAEFAGRVEAGFDAIDGGAPDDCNGHGTHVAAIIGGTTYGVAKNVTLRGVRVLDCEGTGSDSDVIAGVDWVTQDYPTNESPGVMNMSLGGEASDALDAAVRAAIDAGVVVVAAAGNDGVDACAESPAREPAAITVGATDADDARAWFSNYGACVDIFAPGVDILSAWHTSNTAVASLAGTSMAAPHVAGAVALYLSRSPYVKPSEVAAGLVGYATSGVVEDPGAGSPNRLLYVLAASAGPTPTPPPLSTLPPGQGTNGFNEPSAPRVISTLPYRNVADVTSANTNRGSEPWPMNCGDVENANTVWYRYTASASGWLTIDTAGSSYDTVLEAYESSPALVNFVACADDEDDSLQARMGMAVTAGTTYYVQVAAFVNGFDDPAASKRLVLQASLDVGGAGPTPTPTPAPTYGPTPLPVDTPSPTQPWINNVYPETMQVGDDNCWIRVTGFNLSEVTTAFIGTRSVFIDPNPNVSTDEQMFILAPADLAAGTYDVEVCNAAGECGTKPESFTVYGLQPEIYWMLPDRVAYGESTEVWVSGLNFSPEMSMTIGGLPVDEIEVYSPDVLRVRPPQNLAVGVHMVEIVTDGAHTYFPNAFTVFGSDSENWYAFEEDLWSSPPVVRAGDVIELGLNVHRQGGEMPMLVGVTFYEIVDGTPELIGRALTPVMDPGADVIESVGVSWPVTATADSVTVMAVIDEDEWADDLNRADNVVTRTITILPPSDDATAPGVSSFRLNGGAIETDDRRVTVSIGVTEAASAMYIVEREFNTAAGIWVPVQSTGWIAYQSSYPLTLTGKSGLRYVQAWVSDDAGNISAQSGVAVINYNAAPETLTLGQMRMFRYPISLGLTATIRLQTLSGDADLYVWNPDGTLATSSILPGVAVDEITWTATTSGEHQVEVYGYAAGQYQLTVEYGPSGRSAGRAADERPAAKVARDAPVVRPESLPAGVVALSNAPIGGVPSGPVATPTTQPTVTRTATTPPTTPTTPTATRTATPQAGDGQRVYVPLVRRGN